MGQVETMKKMFAGAELGVEDLFLLESFQIGFLPGWVPERELAVVMKARPEIARYLIARCPDVSEFVDQVLREHPGSEDDEELESCGDRVVWTIADLLVYNKCPEIYDALPFHAWDFAEVTSIADLSGKTVVDGGAGTGRVALEAAESAALVYAVEPVARLREFMREKARAKGLSNFYVVDGFLHDLPFPDDYADIVITSHAIAWHLEYELQEFERVVRSPGWIIHCPGTAAGSSDDVHEALTRPPWSYEWARYEEADGAKRKYWKRL